MDVPAQPKYHPELDETKLLDDDNIQLYLSYIGIIRWAIELGRVDLCMASGVMARLSAFPRKRHMVVVLRILRYNKKHIVSRLVFDQEKRAFNDIEWLSGDWSQFYPHLKIGDKPVQSNMPEPRGRSVQITFFVILCMLPVYNHVDQQ